MGMTGSNLIKFSQNSMDKFLDISIKLFTEIIVLFCAFFPTGIINLPAFKKYGYFDPIWIPNEDTVNFIRSTISKEKLIILEKYSEKNSWFVELKNKINSKKDLDNNEISQSYQLLQELQKDVNAFQIYSKTIFTELYIKYI